MLFRILRLFVIAIMLFSFVSCTSRDVMETQPKALQIDDTICEQKVEEIKLLLNDLTTPAKIDNIANKAADIPFDIMRCGRIHESVMYTFTKYGFYPEAYVDFLLKTLESIEYPGVDNRAYEIIKYISSDGTVDDREWKITFKTVQRSSKYYLSGFLRHLFYGTENGKLPADEKVVYERVDEVFDLAKRGKIGLPVAFPFDFVFFQMLDAGYPRKLNFSDTRVLRYIYEKYKDGVPSDRHPKLFNFLKNIYLREQGPAEKEKILNWINAHFKERNADEGLASDLMEFAKLFSDKNYMEEGRVPPGHLKIFIENCRDTLAKALPLVKYKSQRKERVLFCLEHGIAIPGFVPTVKECEEAILSDDYNKQREYLEYLEKIAMSDEDAIQTLLSIKSKTQDERLLHSIDRILKKAQKK